MITSHTLLKKIRFDVDINYAGRAFTITESIWINYGLSFDKRLSQYVLLFKIKVNYIDDGNNNEILGYLGERTAFLKVTTIKTDKIFLITYLFNLMQEVYKYIKENSPITITLLKNVPLNLETKADEILAFLQSNGLY